MVGFVSSRYVCKVIMAWWRDGEIMIRTNDRNKDGQ